MISRIPPALALRLDRASRAAHRHYRYAHHPLCAAYAPEVLSLGRWRACRGCVFVAIGMIAGVGLGLLAHRARLPGPGGWAALIASVATALLAARWRAPKSVSRFLPALALGAGAAQGLAPLAGAALALGAFVAWYQRRGPHRAPCAACPERTARVCSGARRWVRRERAFARLGQRWLDAATRPS